MMIPYKNRTKDESKNDIIDSKRKQFTHLSITLVFICIIIIIIIITTASTSLNTTVAVASTYPPIISLNL
jgi:cell division protein FtsL